MGNVSFSLPNTGLLGGRHMTAEEVLEDHVLRDSIVDSVAQKVSVLMSGAENTSTVIFISASGPGTTVALMGLQKAGYNAQDELASGAVWTIGATEAPQRVIHPTVLKRTKNNLSVSMQVSISASLSLLI